MVERIKKKTKIYLRQTAATLLLIVGLASLSLPLLPGWLFLGVSLYLFSIDSPRAHDFFDKLRKKYPFLDRIGKASYDKIRERHTRRMVSPEPPRYGTL